MELGEAIAVGFVTVFWIGADLYLLFNPNVAGGLSWTLGVSPPVLEWGVFFLGCFASWGTHWVAENAG
jgi:hypothetical protein